MKLALDSLQRHLETTLLPVYLITGDELLLVQESVDAIRRKAAEQGFFERSVFHVEGRFDWQLFMDDSAALSLFAEKKLIELRFRKTGSVRTFKPGKEATPHIETYLTHADESTLLILEMPRLDNAETKKKWYQLVEKTGAILPIWPVELNQFQTWIARRASQKGLRIEEEACQFIAEKVEGNLLAAAQEIDKLAFHSPNAHISLGEVIDAVSESSRYRAFDLSEACLKQDLKRALHIYHGLITEGAQLLPMLGLIHRTLQQVIKISRLRKSGLSPEQACYKCGVTLRNQQGLYLRYAQLLPSSIANELMLCALQVDRAIKGNLKVPPEEPFKQLIIKMCTLR